MICQRSIHIKEIDPATVESAARGDAALDSLCVQGRPLFRSGKQAVFTLTAADKIKEYSH
jgi:hypothetical protein